MSFSDMMNDQLLLRKQSGKVVEGIKSAVTPNVIITERYDVPIESGDLLVRKLPSGLEETFKIIDPGFYQGMSGLSSGYKISYKKLGIPEAEAAIKNITYNFHGHNARVNNNSTDNSNNVVNINNELSESVEALKAEINRLELSAEEKSEAIEVVSAIEEQCKNERPSKVVVSALIKSLPTAASIASIGSLIVSLL
ncbi:MULTISPECIES: hypothetical protein [Pseudoalteromonas]|uniref:Uncharacterized protein n=1 Tax=Pseudoalteromonas tetraodonis TaxID=43659 RepID=A0ABD4ERH8_9GAMM|nr:MULTISPECIES: hypothetical protein [Pseudoalteromonas]KYL36689.1 hypothetical protein A2I96_08740 [Pseudoalteromonas spiralis]MDN3489016.1 hypothetical protein [Pseudoalteromonas sp. APC 3694]QWF33358.1 hypothetical protein KK487_03460 [Pseudoalteromonas sp. SiA1]